MSFINEANFFVVIIALILVFFLLGILFGRLTNRPRKDTSSKNPTANVPTVDQQQTPTLGQEDPGNMSSTTPIQNNRQTDYRNRYYNKYW